MEEKSLEGTDPGISLVGQCWFVRAIVWAYAHRPLPMLSSDRATYQPLLFGKSYVWAWVSLEIEPWEVQEHMQSGEEETQGRGDVRHHSYPMDQEYEMLTCIDGSPVGEGVSGEVHAYMLLQSCPTLLRPHGLQPTRLLCPWDFSGKNTGMVAISFSRESF